ncbi:DUF257 family protein [Pyrococcus sp. ST04]|uniref:DUF257 family protein n=1 Tax=Pyrococcus sp. ST04 TaxID=1183377 RepID=UPI0002605DF3|nr:DUF257 family protein [Pyrococcus sp. ST04]AFK22525.1 hypothetical protein Py04_0943 [Pyrococcus sp. ST04]
MEDIILKLFDVPKFGETILITYPPSFVPEFVVLKLLQYAREKEIPVLIDDNFDALAVLITRLRLLGINLNLGEAYVIKTGGKQRIGKVVGEIKRTSEPRVYLREYSKIFEEISKELGEYINIVLGIEALFKSMNSPLEIYLSLMEVQRFLGNTSRKAFYLVNKDVLETLPFPIKIELERIASSIAEIEPISTNAHVRILKTTAPDFIGREITVDIGGEL